MHDYPAATELQAAGTQAIEKIGTWEGLITQLKHETYEDEDAWESMLLAQLRYLMDVIDRSGAPVTEGMLERLADLQAEWVARRNELAAIVTNDIEPINAWAQARGLKHVVVPGN